MDCIAMGINPLHRNGVDTIPMDTNGAVAHRVAEAGSGVTATARPFFGRIRGQRRNRDRKNSLGEDRETRSG